MRGDRSHMRHACRAQESPGHPTPDNCQCRGPKPLQEGCGPLLVCSWRPPQQGSRQQGTGRPGAPFTAVMQAERPRPQHSPGDAGLVSSHPPREDLLLPAMTGGQPGPPLA